MTEKVVGGLKWVKGEIATTLRRVRDLVESYAGGDDRSGLNDAVDALFEVRGVLLALQLTLPARLVEEMQRLTETMAEGQVKSPREAAEALMLALIQLPNHLERLDAGVELPPLALWPTINDLRESRGVPPLTQAELLVPASVLAEQEDVLTPEELEALCMVVRKVRPHFHRHLVAWFKPDTSEDGLAKLTRLFYHLHRYIRDGILADLFQLAEVYATGLQEGQVAPGPHAHTLLGHLDQVLKQLVGTPPAWPGAEASQLIEELLTALAESDVQSPLVQEMQGQYGQTAALDMAPQGAADALAGLAASMLGEMATLKAQLDLYVRGERDDRAPLEAVRTTLRSLAGTLDVADAGALPERLRMLADRFGELAMADSAEDLARLEPLATEVLAIESVLRAYAEHRPVPKDAEGMLASELKAATLREARGELTRVKEAIAACENPSSRPAIFADLPDQLGRVAGALQILGDDPAAQLSDDLAALVQRRYVAVERWPREAELERLADTVVALEVYLDQLLEEGTLYAEDLIGRAGRSLAALDGILAAGLRAVPNDRPPEAGEADSSAREGPRVEGPAITPEILSIFLDEAQEEIRSIGEHLARWQSHAEDEDALANLRRSFHTLKGSGRLVGAERVAGLAQVAEEILNRVIEHPEAADASLFDFVTDAASLLPELVAAEADARPIDVDETVRRGEELLRSSEPEPAPPARGPVPGGAKVIPWPAGRHPSSAGGQVAAAPDGDGLDQEASPARGERSGVHAESILLEDRASMLATDSELLEIFRNETDEHLSTVREFARQAAAGTNNGVPNETVVRALHTLTGSARMAGIASVGAVTKPLEQRLRQLQVDGTPLGPDLVDLLERAVASVTARVAELPKTGAGALALADLVVELMQPPPGPGAEAGEGPASAEDERSDDIGLAVGAPAAKPRNLGAAAETAPVERSGLAAGQPPSVPEESQPALERAQALDTDADSEDFDLKALGDFPSDLIDLGDESGESTGDAPDIGLDELVALEPLAHTAEPVESAHEENLADLQLLADEPAMQGLDAREPPGFVALASEASADNASPTALDELTLEPEAALETALAEAVEWRFERPVEAALSGPELESEREPECEAETQPLPPGLDVGVETEPFALSPPVQDSPMSAVTDTADSLPGPAEAAQGIAPEMTFDVVGWADSGALDLEESAVREAVSELEHAGRSESAFDLDSQAPRPTAEPAIAESAAAHDDSGTDVLALEAPPSPLPTAAAAEAPAAGQPLLPQAFAPPQPTEEAEPAAPAEPQSTGEADSESAVSDMVAAAETPEPTFEHAEISEALGPQFAPTVVSETPAEAELAADELGSTLQPEPLPAAEAAQPDTVPASLETAETSAPRWQGPPAEGVAPSPISVPIEEHAALPIAAHAPPEPGDDFQAAAADPELATLFLEDARDLLDGIDARIREWQFAPQELGALAGINRMLHTLKGSARLTGLTAIGDLSHALETRLIAIGGAYGAVDDLTVELAQRAVDALSVQVDALEQGAPIPRASALVEALSRPPETPAAGPAEGPELPVMRPAPTVPATGPAEESAPPPEAPPPQPPGPAPAQTAPAPSFAALVAERDGVGAVGGVPQIRVRADLLNRLVDNSGEISLYRARLSQRNGLLGFGLGELDQTVTRLRDRLRLLEIETEAQILHRFEREGLSEEDGAVFDPLELDRFSTLQQLSRSLAETVNDLVSLKELLGGYQRETADLLTQQARLAEDLQDGLLRTRMVPFVQVVPRLHRLVRQTADSTGKAARLEVIGPEVELDRTILDRLVAPLEHLLRNAVDHGLETADGRAEARKPATGVIALALSREGNDVVIRLSDDGRGLDLAAIRRKAVSKGLLAPNAQIADDALMQLVFERGFTTHDKVTQISGRGVGLDVVTSEIKAANGSIALTSQAGNGTTFTIRLPLTLAIIEAFLVSAGDNIYAIPHTTIEGAARIGRDQLLAMYRGKGGDFEYRSRHYRVAYLGGVLDPRQEPELGERRWLPLLLARTGELRVALQVDNILESQRIVVKPLGPQLAGVRWLSGGTILPDGRVALILDALALLRSGTIQDYLPTQPAPAAISESPLCVMVVDDSLTVRRVTSRLLRRQNMEVLTAKDGVEALTLLDERVPDLMLLDIEMPRMDGYELTRHVRRSERLRHLPIIMITSRAGDKHRDHALSLGVNRYLGKPYQESDLLDEIGSLLAEQRG